MYDADFILTTTLRNFINFIGRLCNYVNFFKFALYYIMKYSRNTLLIANNVLQLA